jgi:hypothetical protein
MIKLKELLNEIEESCWDTHKQIGMKEKDGRMVPNCVRKEELETTIESNEEIVELLNFLEEQSIELDEVVYQGRSVKLNKPMRGDVKKFKVYVRNPVTKKIKKVNFGDPNMRIKKSNPKRRKSFRARHHCDTNPGPKTKARYWSCRKW